MKKRKINFTVEIDGNDLIEHNLLKFLRVNLGQSMVNYQVLQDSKELYDSDDTFKAICKSYKKAKKERDDYIWSQRK